MRRTEEAEHVYALFILFKNKKKWNSGISASRKIFGADLCTFIRQDPKKPPELSSEGRPLVV